MRHKLGIVTIVLLWAAAVAQAEMGEELGRICFRITPPNSPVPFDDVLQLRTMYWPDAQIKGLFTGAWLGLDAYTLYLVGGVARGSSAAGQDFELRLLWRNIHPVAFSGHPVCEMTASLGEVNAYRMVCTGKSEVQPFQLNGEILWYEACEPVASQTLSLRSDGISESQEGRNLAGMMATPQ